MVITLEEKDNHDLKYEGGMVTTWNKFCFTGGLIEGKSQSHHPFLLFNHIT